MSIADFNVLFEELNHDQAQNFDPVRFAYLQSLSVRLTNPRHQKNAALIKKALDSLQRYRNDLSKQRRESEGTIKQLSEVFPKHLEEAEALFLQCKFKSLEHLHNRLCQQNINEQALRPLRSLTHGLNQASDGSNNEHEPESPSIDELLHQQELKARLAKGEALAAKIDSSSEQLEMQSMKHFRESMKHFNIDKIIARAIDEGPENPGPLNPQMLAIKSLANMRDLSPEYLRRFAGYIETLMWLEKSTAKLNSSKNTP